MYLPCGDTHEDRVAIRQMVDRIKELEKSVADYEANLGDIVTYGTTADILDQHLQDAYAKINRVKDILAKKLPHANTVWAIEDVMKG